MKKEKSCGAVVFNIESGKIKYLLVRNLSGVYGFPKGHVENNETEEEIAIREVFEETGVKVALIPGFKEEEMRLVVKKEKALKEVIYFLGYYSDQEYNYPQEELSGAFLVDYDEAMDLFIYESSKRILKSANEFIIKNNLFK